jgi:phosphotriesterase-related protein
MPVDGFPRTTRRALFRLAAAACAGALPSRLMWAGSADPVGQVMTVLGPVPPGVFGRTLPHEHVLVDFAGADRTRPETYDLDAAYRLVLPQLLKITALGCRGFVECTPAFLGRSPQLLARLARASGLHIVTNTGYYGAGGDRFVPSHARSESADAIADRWTAEWRAGIDGTGIRPGFIKTGVDAAPLSVIDRKLVQAAARTHLRTGLTIASHTADTRGALEQLSVLHEEGVAPDAFIWVHAQNDWSVEARTDAARKGVWIEVDNIGNATREQDVQRVNDLKRAGVLNRLLVSHDGGWYDPAVPGGGNFRPFDLIYRSFVPALQSAGWTPADLRQLLVGNPAAAFTVRVRTAATTEGRGGARLA